MSRACPATRVATCSSRFRARCVIVCAVRIAVALIAAACGKSSPPAALVDLSASLDPLRREFDAHAGEARFVALLSPT